MMSEKDAILDNQMNQHQAMLKTLFTDQTITQELNKNLKKIHAYYNHQLLVAQNYPVKQKEIEQEYEFLLEHIQEVKQGNMSAEKALKNTEILSNNRKLELVYHNILNTCELLFWLAAAATSYGLYVGFGIPLLFTNLLLGAAITIGTSVAMIDAGLRAQQCLDKYQSFNAVNEQEQAEQNAISFFATRNSQEKSPINDNEDSDRIMDYSSNYGSC